MSNSSPEFEKWHKTFTKKSWTYAINSAGFYDEQVVQLDHQIWLGATKNQAQLLKRLKAENALLNDAITEDKIFMAMDAARKSEVNQLRKILINTWDWVDPNAVPKGAVNAYQQALLLIPGYPESGQHSVSVQSNPELVVDLPKSIEHAKLMLKVGSAYLEVNAPEDIAQPHNEQQDDLKDALQAFLKFANSRRQELGVLSEEMELVVAKAESAIAPVSALKFQREISEDLIPNSSAGGPRP